MKKKEKLEVTLCGRAVAVFGDEADLMKIAPARICEWDAIARDHASKTIDLALAAGALLLAVKSRLPHGTFLLWFSQNCGSVSERTARNYMALAERRQREFEGADRPLLTDGGESAAAAPVDERSLTDLYREYGIVRRDPESNWGGDRRKEAAKNGKTVGRKPKGSPEEVAKELDAAANYEPAMWASAEGAIKTVADLDAEKQLFSRLEDGHLAMAAQMLGDLARKAGEALKARLARRDMGLHGEAMQTGEVVKVLEGGL